MISRLLRTISNRRSFLSAGALLPLAPLVAGSSSGAVAAQHVGTHPATQSAAAHIGGMTTVGTVDHRRNGFDPLALLTDWETGTLETDATGRRVRSFDITAVDVEIEIAPGIFFPAWTYNGRVPGPALRAREGEWLRVRFANNGSHTHSMHFHGIHGASMDGIAGAGLVAPGESFVYEFPAKPFGCHLYHCHSVPLKRHIHKGLYGAFIVDPDPALHAEHAEVARSRQLGTPANAEWQELVMVMNGFDTNFDDENEIYAVNTVAHEYMKRPIKIDRDRPVRIYLINVTEFDPVNSFHIHGNFFDYFDHGTTLTPTLMNIDTVMQCQAQRGIIEMSFRDHEPGHYMFHAHQSEFAELGWMSFFEVA